MVWPTIFEQKCCKLCYHDFYDFVLYLYTSLFDIPRWRGRAVLGLGKTRQLRGLQEQSSSKESQDSETEQLSNESLGVFVRSQNSTLTLVEVCLEG